MRKDMQIIVIAGAVGLFLWLLTKSGLTAAGQINPNTINPLTGKPYGVGASPAPVLNPIQALVAALTGATAVTNAAGQTVLVPASTTTPGLAGIPPGTTYGPTLSQLGAGTTAPVNSENEASVALLQGNATIGSAGIQTTDPTISTELSPPADLSELDPSLSSASDIVAPDL